MQTNYNPFPYQPLMRYYYGEPHADAVAALGAQLQATNPSAYATIIAKRPDLFDAGFAVRSGLMGLNATRTHTMRGMNGLRGMGDATTDASAAPLTDWGKQLMDLAKTYLVYDSQKQLMSVNIARAEQGLPPISSADLAATVNVGASPAVQTLGYVAIGGLVIAGLAMAFKGSGRRR